MSDPVPTVSPASGRVASSTPPSVRADLPRGFEAMILRPLLDAALPSGEAVFGTGTAGDTWRSMLIDTLARDWAEQGSLGIGERLLDDHLAGRS